MSDAALRCPGCGAPANADSARCTYCGAALATATCPSCFAPMFVGSRFCAHCGAEATREVMEDETPLHCPRCKEPLQSLKLGPTAVHECGACGGLWVDPQSLQKLCDAREAHSAVVSVLAARVPTAPIAQDPVRYIPCPKCTKLMNRVNFAKSSGVIVDVCKSDGVWLDRGELQRVVGFIDGGGLEVAREHERERLVEEQRRLAALEQHASAPAFATQGTIAWSSSSSTSNPAIEQLLRDALGIFLK